MSSNLPVPVEGTTAGPPCPAARRGKAKKSRALNQRPLPLVAPPGTVRNASRQRDQALDNPPCGTPRWKNAARYCYAAGRYAGNPLRRESLPCCHAKPAKGCPTAWQNCAKSGGFLPALITAQQATTRPLLGIFTCILALGTSRWRSSAGMGGQRGTRQRGNAVLAKPANRPR